MKTSTTYIGTLNNVKGFWCGEAPEEATISEERQVLRPDEGMVLHKIGTDIYSYGIWLENNNIEEWEEITQEEYDEIMKEMEKKNGSI